MRKGIARIERHTGRKLIAVAAGRIDGVYGAGAMDMAARSSIVNLASGQRSALPDDVGDGRSSAGEGAR